MGACRGQGAAWQQDQGQRTCKEDTQALFRDKAVQLKRGVTSFHVPKRQTALSIPAWQTHQCIQKQNKWRLIASLIQTETPYLSKVEKPCGQDTKSVAIIPQTRQEGGKSRNQAASTHAQVINCYPSNQTSVGNK